MCIRDSGATVVPLDLSESTLLEDKNWYESAITKSIGKAHKINVLNF